MYAIKELLLDIQKRLSNVESLKYIDKDWGQFHFTPLPVKFPCALIDIDAVSYSSLARGNELVEVKVSITIVNQRLRASSWSSNTKELSYETFKILEEVHNILQNKSDEWYAPLIRQSLTKVYTDNANEVYKLVYATSFKNIQ